MIFFRQFAVAIFTLSMLLSIGAAGAEARRDAAGSGDAVRKAQYMLRKLSQEKASLQQENARLSAEIKELETQAKKLEKKLESTAKQLERANASNDKLVERVKNDREKITDLIGRYRETVRRLRVEQANVIHLTNAVQERNQWIDTCKANNGSLYEINMELVDRYRNKGLWQALRQAEPLTGIGEVQLEVIAEDYVYKIEDLQVANFETEEEAESAEGQ